MPNVKSILVVPPMYQAQITGIAFAQVTSLKVYLCNAVGEELASKTYQQRDKVENKDFMQLVQFVKSR